MASHLEMSSNRTEGGEEARSSSRKEMISHLILSERGQTGKHLVFSGRSGKGLFAWRVLSPLRYMRTRSLHVPEKRPSPTEHLSLWKRTQIGEERPFVYSALYVPEMRFSTAEYSILGNILNMEREWRIFQSNRF